MRLGELEVLVQVRVRRTGDVVFGRKDTYDGVEGQWYELSEGGEVVVEPDDRAQTTRRGILRAVDRSADELRDHLEQIWGLG